MGFHHFFFMASRGGQRYDGSGTLVLGGKAITPFHYYGSGGLVLSGSAQATSVSCNYGGSRCFIIGQSSNELEKLYKARSEALEKLAALRAIVPSDPCDLPTGKC